MNALVQINEQVIEVILQGPPGPMGPPDNTLRTDLAANDGDTLIGTQSGASLRERIAALQAAIDAIDTSGGGGGDATIRTELLDTAGDTMIGTQDGSTLRVKLAGLASTASSLIASLAAKANDVVVTRTPLHYGCVGDGVANDYANMLTALQSGFAIDGLGKTYAISSQLAPTSFKGLRNATLKWNSTANMQVQNRALLLIQNLDNWFIDRCKFDMGTVENIGATGAPDNARAGFKTTNSSYSDRCHITNNEVFGAGAGTGLELRDLKHSVIHGNIVRDRVVADTGITNDAQNGIQIDNSVSVMVSSNVVTGLYLRIAGVATKKWSRGFCITGVSDSSFVNNSISFVDQAFDFSGGPTPGNRGITISGNVASDVWTWGFKFANCFRDGLIVGNMARRFGYGGFVFSGQGTGVVANDTQRVLVTGNYAMDPTGEYSASCVGFWVGVSAIDPSYPRGIRLIGNVASDTSGGGKLAYGFLSQAGYGGFPINESINNDSRGHVTAAVSGFPRKVCQLTGTGTQSIANSTATAVQWDVESEDTLNMHSNSTNPSRVTVPEAGWYRVKGAVAFANNASGWRVVIVKRNGAAMSPPLAVDGNSITLATVQFDYEVVCTAGQYIEVTAEQNSGGALNIDRTNSSLSVEFIRYI